MALDPTKKDVMRSEINLGENGRKRKPVGMAGCLTLVLASVAVTGCSTPRPDPNPMPQPLATHRIEISRHASVALPASRADEILAEMGDILRTRDGGDDVLCNVAFMRKGEIGELTEGTGSINSAQDFVAVNNAPGNVKVVNQINWCGGFAPNILGCTQLFRDSMIVVRYSADAEAILWLHEFGHSQGLEHRDGATAVMNAAFGPFHRRVDSAECESLRWGATVPNPIPE
jgi:hypothetical protein